MSVQKKTALKKLILISSDKAVRPTSIMGISKRISELIVQAFAEESAQEIETENIEYTSFSMVRFGNVLNSSGVVCAPISKALLTPAVLAANSLGNASAIS